MKREVVPMRYKVLLFLSGILMGLGVFESLGGYFAIANHVAKTSMPAYYGLTGVLYLEIMVPCLLLLEGLLCLYFLHKRKSI